jgi:signal transduction histidine kinase
VFVVLAVSTGVGLLAYVAGSMLLPVAGPGGPGGPAGAFGPRGIGRTRGRSLERVVAAALVLIGGGLLLRALGLWFGRDLSLPAALAGVGFALVWSRTDVERREQWRARVSQTSPGVDETSGRAMVLRVALGGVLLLAGAGSMLALADPQALGQVIVAIAATTGGAALLVGPWVLRLWRDLTSERRERIRSEERAELAAHLHDSVLQTLVLVQRNPQTPRDVALLARAQERELREWLYPPGGGAVPAADGGAPASLAAAVRRAAADAEARHGVPVEVVTVGDAPVDERVDALVQATKEAVVNAARHSGADEVSVYVEARPEAIDVYVRDRGCGFDVDAVPDDRHGLRHSVEARLARHGGSARVGSALGEGTEIVMGLPR